MSLLNSSCNNITDFCVVPEASSAQVAASRLIQLTNLPYHHRCNPVQNQLTEIPGPIEFREFDFHYPARPSQNILASLNLKIPLCSTVGWVGLSGSGKSTILLALLGLYSESVEPESSAGSFQLGHNPVKSIDLPALRALIGYVPQQVTLFPDTIANNISYGLDKYSPRASKQSINEAAQLAGIDDVFIHSLPDGLETRVGEGGHGLSAGQIQRIGIARAFVRRPKLLIMDEPTSHLDEKGAKGIRDVIKMLARHGTTIAVATHSVDMMRSLDHLYVIEGGQAVENGCWDDLIQRNRSHLRYVLEADESSN